MRKFTLKILAVIFPLFAFAQTTIRGVIETIQGLLDFVIPILIVLATVIFIWGLIWYIGSSGKEDKQKEARSIMVWGVIILFVIVAVWGLVEVIGSTFKVPEEHIPEGPELR